MGGTSKSRGRSSPKKSPQHPLGIGFDPDTTDLHPFLAKQLKSTPLESFLVRWYQAVVARIAEPGVSIKLQSAFFEQFGPPGMIALRDISIDAKRRGLYVILDAKRGDISSTMRAYGQAAFDYYQADALTILPWMGTDSLEALMPWLKDGKRVYIVWLSSNASGRQLQMHASTTRSTPIARVVYDQFTALAKKEKVLDQIGWVLGATDLPSKILAALPRRPHHFLLPGIGAQGATFGSKTNEILKRHPSSIFPVSRGILKVTPDDHVDSWDTYTLAVEQKWLALLRSCQDSLKKSK
jgi:orotidine-5'-phosphate decarboxylase